MGLLLKRGTTVVLQRKGGHLESWLLVCFLEILEVKIEKGSLLMIIS
jgi:hypothetical protein